MDQLRRPSIYLQERAEGLGRVLEFFLAPQRGQSPGPKEMLVVFLAQLGFWEWELDNLVYAFQTFAERAEAWEHENGFGIANALKTRGLWVQTAAVKDFKARRQARASRKHAVFAPIQSLNQVNAQWNELLELCEQRVLIAGEERALALVSGVQMLPDLAPFRKAPLGKKEASGSGPALPLT